MSSPPTILTTRYTTIEWSADGRAVTKRRLPRPDAAGRHRYELRVNQLLGRRPPPVRIARLLAHDRRGLRFEAVPGTPLGPKYPERLDTGQIDAMVDLAQGLRGYQPHARWMRSFRSARRIELAVRHGFVTSTEGGALQLVAKQVHTQRRFAHGDLTARNVLVSQAGEMAVIDWEWAGLYPPEYDLAFLWFTLVDVPHARERVESRASSRERLLLSALLIQLWHLQWYTPTSFLGSHLRTRDELIARLLG